MLIISQKGVIQIGAYSPLFDYTQYEVMSMLTDLTVTTSHHFRVIEQLRGIVVVVLQDDQLPIQSQRDILDFMRKNETSFPHFRNSNTYKLFEPPVFENKIKANGYWF